MTPYSKETPHTRPLFFAVAGAPGVGKTTYVNHLLTLGVLPAQAFRHDCDATMVAMPEYQADLKRIGAEAAFKRWELPARKAADALLEQALKQGLDILYDRTCALPEIYEFICDLVQEGRYRFEIHLIEAEPEEIQKRLKLRNETSGRHTSPELYLERAVGIQNLWPKYVELADSAAILTSKDQAFVRSN